MSGFEACPVPNKCILIHTDIASTAPNTALKPTYRLIIELLMD